MKSRKGQRPYVPKEQRQLWKQPKRKEEEEKGKKENEETSHANNGLCVCFVLLFIFWFFFVVRLRVATFVTAGSNSRPTLDTVRLINNWRSIAAEWEGDSRGLGGLGFDLIDFFCFVFYRVSRWNSVPFESQWTRNQTWDWLFDWRRKSQWPFGLYWVLLGFVAFLIAYCVITGFYWVFLCHYWVLLGFSRV